MLGFDSLPFSDLSSKQQTPVHTGPGSFLLGNVDFFDLERTWPRGEDSVLGTKLLDDRFGVDGSKGEAVVEFFCFEKTRQETGSKRIACAGSGDGFDGCNSRVSDVSVLISVGSLLTVSDESDGFW